MRIVMLRADGLHSIEGPLDLTQRDAVAGPVLLAASGLLEQGTCAVK